MVRPVRNVRECLALDGEPGVSVAGRTYAAVMSADTLFITIPTGVGVDIHVKILENFAAHVAPRWVGSRTVKDQSSAIPSTNSCRSQDFRVTVSSAHFK